MRLFFLPLNIFLSLHKSSLPDCGFFTIFVPVKKSKFPLPLLVVSFLAVACAQQAFAQIDSSATKSSFHDFYLLNPANSILITDSTSIPSFLQIYDPLDRNYLGDPRSGNMGSASFSFLGNLNDYRFFRDGFNQFNAYMINPGQTTLNGLKRRFTNINYHLGSKKEQHIFISHKQEFKKGLVAGLDFGALSSPGDFSRQLNKNRNFNIYAGYESKAKTYRNFISYTSNKVENQENGGIVADSVFEDASDLNTKTLPISLVAATSSHRTRDYFVKQEFQLSNLFSKKDSSSAVTQFTEKGLVLSHTSWWSRKSIEFVSLDADTSYFTNFFKDSTATNDSSFYYDGFHQAGLDYHVKLTNGKFSVGAAFEYQDAHYRTDTVNYDQFMSVGALKAHYENQVIDADFSFRKSISEKYDQVFESQIHIGFTPVSKFFKVWATIKVSKRPQYFRDQLYVSNHFRWVNNFDPAEQLRIETGAYIPSFKLKAQVTYMSIGNYVYFNENAAPQMLGKKLNYVEARLLHSWQIGKFGTDNMVRIQQIDKSPAVYVPDLALFSSLYYHNTFFKNALRLRLGVDVSFATETELYQYMPATGFFYESSSKKAGSYPKLDLVGVLKIGTANIFVKLEHFNAGLSERDYYGAYLHPLTGRNFKFGLSWDLAD
jgi:Putative porin